ncbi:MAG: aldehyde dehydrogenase family protein, partial [Candidatus Kapaibacterium sp.]
MKEFRNELFLDFSKKQPLQRQQSSIEAVRKRFGKEYPNIIDGKKVVTEKKTVSVNPAQPSEVIGVFQKSGIPDAEKAIKAAARAFETWKNVPVKERAAYLFKAARVIRERRTEINAWMISEVGKNYLEADADTCEAIDFLEFYG